MVIGMNFGGVLLAVKDMTKAKQFYVEVMEQKIAMDLDNVHVAFESGFSLQADYQGLLGVPLNPKEQSDNFQLYFEVEDLDKWEDKLSKVEEIDFLHHSKEYPWGSVCCVFTTMINLSWRSQKVWLVWRNAIWLKA